MNSQQQPIQEQIYTTTSTNIIPPSGGNTLGNNNLGSNNLGTNRNTSGGGKQKRGLFGRKKAKSANYGNGSGLNNSLNSTYGNNTTNSGLGSGYGYGNGNNSLTGFGVGDVTHHSYRWAHRDRNLAISDNYGGAPPRGVKASRRGNRRSTGSLGNRQLQQGQPIVQQTQSTTTTQGLQGYPQQSFQTTIVEEVPVGGMGGMNNSIGNNGLAGNNIPAATTKKRHPFQTFFGRKHHDSGFHTGMLGSGPTGGIGFPSRTNVVA